MTLRFYRKGVSLAVCQNMLCHQEQIAQILLLPLFLLCHCLEDQSVLFQKLPILLIQKLNHSLQFAFPDSQVCQFVVDLIIVNGYLIQCIHFFFI